MRTPADKTITLTFYSHPMKDLKMRWKAQLVFAAGSTDASFATLTVADGEGKLLCGNFVKGKHEPGIWLYRKGQAPVPGALTFE